MKQLGKDAPAQPAEVTWSEDGGISGVQTGNFSGFEMGLTALQHACIALELPESGVEWLDKLIAKKQRQTLAGQAMQGLLAAKFESLEITTWEQATNYADTLINELNK